MAQNGTSNRTGLPHGMVPFHQIADPQVRDAVMLLNENIAWLAKRPAGSGDVSRAGDAAHDAQEVLALITENYPDAAAAAAAISQTLSATIDAEAAAGSAETSAGLAAGSATAAAASAAAAASSAGGALFCTSFSIRGVDLGTNSARWRFYMEPLVPDTSKNYSVTVTFVNESSTAQTCKFAAGAGSSWSDVALEGTAGASASITGTVAGDSFFAVDNQNAQVSVTIKIKEMAMQEGGTVNGNT